MVTVRARVLLLGLGGLLGLGAAGCERSKSTTQVAPSGRPKAGAPGSKACAKQLVGNTLLYTCALLTSGQAQCWGMRIPGKTEYLYTQPVTLTGYPTPATQLFVDSHVICASAVDGGLWCGGGSSHGQLTRPPSDDYSLAPLRQPFQDMKQFTRFGRCLLDGQGLSCWPLAKAPEPKLVTGLPAKVTQLVGGFEYACVLLENGQVYCRGTNLRGQLGILEGATEDEREKSRLRRYETFTQVRALGDDTRLLASSGRHSCALKRDGSVWCWGENEYGQVGKGDVSKCKSGPGWLRLCDPEEGLVPTRVEGLPAGVRDLALGEASSCAVDEQGRAWCWGFLATPPSPRPVLLKVGDAIQTITLGHHWCVLLRNGEVRCQGESPTMLDWSQAATMNLACP